MVPAQTLKGDELTAWTESVAVLADMSGLDADKSEELLTRAFGWSSQVYWRKEKVNEVPDPKQVSVRAIQHKRLITCADAHASLPAHARRPPPAGDGVAAVSV